MSDAPGQPRRPRAVRAGPPDARRRTLRTNRPGCRDRHRRQELLVATSAATGPGGPSRQGRVCPRGGDERDLRRGTTRDEDEDPDHERSSHRHAHACTCPLGEAGHAYSVGSTDKYRAGLRTPQRPVEVALGQTRLSSILFESVAAVSTGCYARTARRDCPRLASAAPVATACRVIVPSCRRLLRPVERE